MLKKEEFDDYGVKTKNKFRTWSQFHVILEGNQIVFSPSHTQMPAESSFFQITKESFTKAGSLMNIKTFIGDWGNDNAKKENSDIGLSNEILTDEEKSRTLPVIGKKNMREAFAKMLHNQTQKSSRQLQSGSKKEADNEKSSDMATLANSSKISSVQALPTKNSENTLIKSQTFSNNNVR